MFKSAPKAPDPYKTAAAQTQQNITTANAETFLDRPNQYTPYGSSEWERIGKDVTGADQWKNTVTLSPAEQAKLAQQNQLDLNLGQFANNQLGRVSTAMDKGIDYNGAPQAPVPFGFLEVGKGPELSSSIAGYDPNAKYTPVSTGSFSSKQAGDVTRSIATRALQDQFSGYGDIQTGIDKTQLQTQMQGAGDITKSFGDYGDVQQNLDLSGLTALPGNGDYAAERQRVEDALYGRQTAMLDPQFQQQQTQLETRLATMGIARGSQAWQREVDNFSRNRDNAYAAARNDAITGGGAEQSRLFGMALTGRQQGYNEVLGSGQFANSAQQQRYNQSQGAATFANQAQQQQFGQNLAEMEAENTAQNQAFQQNVTQGNFANTAQQQQYDQSKGAAQFYNDTQNARYTQDMGNASLNNSAQNQVAQQEIAGAQLANQAAQVRLQEQQQQFGQKLAAQSFSNDALTNQFMNRIAGATMTSAQQQQQFNQMTAARQQNIQEQAYARNLPINDIATLLGNTSGVQQPQFQTANGGSVAPVDLMSAIYANYNAKNAAYQQNMGGIMGLLGTGASMAMMSDARRKENIVRIGETAHGIPTYRFNYVGDDMVEFGVMAQDVMDIPGAVIHDNDNDVYYVNYGKVW